MSADRGAGTDFRTSLRTGGGRGPGCGLQPGRGRRLALALALLAAGGCGGGQEGPGSDPEGAGAPGDANAFAGPRVPAGVETVRLLAGPDGELRIIACDAPGAERNPGQGGVPEAGSGRAVQDASGQGILDLAREFGAPPEGIPVRVVLEGDRVVRLRVALPEAEGARGCELAFPDADLDASGNEPFWHVRVEGSEVLLRTPDNPEGTLFHDLAWAALEGAEAGWRAEALRDFVDGIEYLVLDVTEVPCVDSMSGARFPWTAVLDQGGRRLSGCAREGRGLPVSTEP